MKWLLLAVLGCLSVSIVFAQKLGKTIQGTVWTSDNKRADGIVVTLTPSSAIQVTDDEGSFKFSHLDNSLYSVSASIFGHVTGTQQVDLSKLDNGHVELYLQITQAQLEEVIVTSRRHHDLSKMSNTLRLNEPIVQTPQNIQILSSKQLSEQLVTDMGDGVLRNISGAIRLEHWGDTYVRVNARGSQLSAFRDGMNVVISPWSPLTEDMSVVDHMEVVKGPAGFMMSLGDPAGIYNVVTKKPTGETKGSLDLQTGSYGLYRAAIDLDGKLDKKGKLLYRLNFMGQEKNSFRPYEYNNRISFAPTLTYLIDDKTTLTAQYMVQKVKMSNVGSAYVFSTKGYAVLPRDFTTLDPGIEPTHITDQSFYVNFQHKFNDQWKFTAQGAYLRFNSQGSSMWPTAVGDSSMIRNVSIWDSYSEEKTGQAYFNGDVQTGAVHHRIIAGLDGYNKTYMADWNQSHDLDTKASPFLLYSPTYGFPSNGYPVWDRSKSLEQRAGVYGQIAQNYTGLYLQDELGFFNNKLRLTLAGRYSYAWTNSYNSKVTNKQFTPRVGLSYSFDDQTSAYALYDKAFSPQTGLRRDGNEVKPLTGNNMEIGLKRVLLNGKLSANLAAYRIVRNNDMTSDPTDPTGTYVVQFGQSVAKGIEFDLNGELAKGLTGTINYAYTDSKITKSDTSTASQLTIGNKVPGYAKHTINFWLNYKVQDGVLKGFGVSGGWTFLADRTTWAWSATKRDLLPDYTKFDGGVFWEKDKLRITCNVYNLANRYLYSGANYGSYYYWQAEAGRNWRLGISYKF